MTRAILWLALALLWPAAVKAMTFSAAPLGQAIGIIATGAIVPGDDAKLHLFAARLPASAKLGFIMLDSPGGNIGEASRLAETIRHTRLVTMVGNGGECASACFLLFAAGAAKMASSTALIGVHSASDAAGRDTASAQASTTLMARYAAHLGVPAAIIGRMVATPPGAIAWLSAGELRAMGVEIVAPKPASGYVPGSALRPGNESAASTAGPPASASTPAASFDRGLADRTRYEHWFASIPAAAQAGAGFWAANRSAARKGEPVSCHPPGAAPLWAWGCASAKARLDPADRQRLADAEYRRGWNSY